MLIESGSRVYTPLELSLGVAPSFTLIGSPLILPPLADDPCLFFRPITNADDKEDSPLALVLVLAEGVMVEAAWSASEEDREEFEGDRIGCVGGSVGSLKDFMGVGLSVGVVLADVEEAGRGVDLPEDDSRRLEVDATNRRAERAGTGGGGILRRSESESYG